MRTSFKARCRTRRTILLGYDLRAEEAAALVASRAAAEQRRPSAHRDMDHIQKLHELVAHIRSAQETAYLFVPTDVFDMKLSRYKNAIDALNLVLGAT